MRRPTYYPKIASPDRILVAVQALWNSFAIPNATRTVEAFTATVTGGLIVALRAFRDQSLFSFHQLSAMINDLPCNISAVSDDGMWALLSFPYAQQLCRSNLADCGYVDLSMVLNASRITSRRR